MAGKRILFLKVVAYDTMNEAIKKYLNEYKDRNTELEVRSLAVGPKHLEYQFYQAAAGAGILKEVLKAEKDGFDAVVTSCFDDPFLYPARESSMHLASVLGSRFSVIVGRDKWIPQMRENVYKYGFGEKLASFRSLGLGVLDFHRDEELTLKKMKEEIRKAIEEDRAEVIILGCSMLFGFYRELLK